MRPKLFLGVGLFALGLLSGRYLLPARPVEAGEPPGPVVAAGDTGPVRPTRDASLSGPPKAPKARAPEAARLVFLVRHAEKETSDDTDAPLSAVGLARARRLADLFGQMPVDVLLASDLRRTQQTLKPLADKKGLAIETTSSDPKAADIVGRIRTLPPGRVAVVAHHSFTIPPILAGLGFKGGTWTTVTGHDQVWIIRLPAAGPPGLVPLRSE